MGSPAPPITRRVASAALVATVAIGVPLVALVPLGDRSLVSSGVLAAAFGLVLVLRTGRRRALRLAPLVVVTAALGALAAGTTWWVPFVAVLGAGVGVAAWLGWGAGAVMAAFVAVSMPPLAPGSGLGVRVAVVAVALGYALGAARLLHVPRELPTTRLDARGAVVAGAALALAGGAAAAVAASTGSGRAAWVPGTVLLLALPSAGLTLRDRALHRVVGTVLGAAAALAVTALHPPPGFVLGAVPVLLVAFLAVREPLWFGTTLVTTALMLLLGASVDDPEPAGARVAATVLAVAVVAALAAVGALAARLVRRPPDAVVAAPAP